MVNFIKIKIITGPRTMQPAIKKIQGVLVLSYPKNNIKYLKKVLDKYLWIRYMSNHVTLHPGGNCVEPAKSPCPAHPSV
jgi:hypothetical protein